MLDSTEKADPRGRAPNQNARAFQQVLHEVFGVPFAVFDAGTGARVATVGSAQGRTPRWEPDPPDVTRLVEVGPALVEPCEGSSFRISLLLHTAGTPSLVAVGVVPALSPAGGARAVEQARLQAWARDFAERLRLRDQLSARVKAEEDLRTQVAAAWKVNLALSECMQRLRFNRHELRDSQRILQSALQLLHAQALVWVPLEPGRSPVLAGEALVSPDLAGRLARDLENTPEASGPEPYLCNDPRRTPWGSCFPKIDNLLALNATGPAFSGWLIALNKYGKVSPRAADAEPPRAPFRTSDAALLHPFATMLHMHARAAGKFDELRALLMGLARSLTAAVDAKDAYTAGHSERVARMAVEIGREMGLPDEQLSDTYLAGLMHDVGTIGIREGVLFKPGRLTPEELEHVKEHVRIGYHILQDLHPIRHLLPVVLYHHERYDGKGYPEGLAGEQIPSLARLLAVADGFDAMSTHRPYRPALSRAEVLEELLKGAGTQWDPQVVAAALRCTDRLMEIHQRGLGESLRQAADAALRTGESSLVDPVEDPLPVQEVVERF